MTTLPNNLRNGLSRIIVRARELAEAGARVALEALAVHHHEPYGHMDTEPRALRNRLRVHGRQLGDWLDRRSGTQAIQHLVEECAYEHWHRMLFARFLAENDLLIDPETGVAITLEECRDLAREEGTDQWTLAAQYAQGMLPQIFRVDHPVFQLDFARNDRVKLEQLLESVPSEVFQASDSLGWVYQFWQAKKKEEVNASEVKIGADELPVVTQLFTEPYMVHFLLDNSLGAWWAARNLSEAILKNASTEEELRKKAAIPGVPLEFLRFVKKEDGSWSPVAGTFDAWPQHLSELKTLDPCCGSGHFLVAVFLMLVPMRMQLEGLSAQEAVDAVISDNIYGLELDARCVEIAAFAIALNAWRYPDAGCYRALPELHLACTGLSINAQMHEWLALADEDPKLSLALEELYRLFKEAPILGSLIDPRKSLSKGQLFESTWEDVRPLLTKALTGDRGIEEVEMAVVAKGSFEAAVLLANKYHLLVTNPPYLVKGKQIPKLQEFLTRYYSAGDADIATVFLKRFDNFLKNGGTHCSVTPLNWYYLKSYEKLRIDLLDNSSVLNLTKVGSGATAKASWDVLRAVAIISKGKPDGNALVTSIEAGSSQENERAEEIRTGGISISTIQKLRNLPDSKFSFGIADEFELLEKYVWPYQGLATADYSQFGRCFWEVRRFGTTWSTQHGTFKATQDFGGLENILMWEGGEGRLSSNPKARIQGLGAHEKCGIVVTQTRQLPASLYLGGFFDNNVSILAVNEESHSSAIWCFCSSDEYAISVRKLDEKLGVTNATLAKVPFDVTRWTKIAKKKYPNGLPKPYSDNPTQWIFHGHPCGSVVWNAEVKWTDDGLLLKEDTVLQVAVARLLGYRWPAELDSEIELADEQREWVHRCEALLSHADDDGIVCLPAVSRELPAHERLLTLIQAAYGDDWHAGTLNELLSSVGCKGKSLDFWLRDRFFEQHCKLFQHRPFIWHIWDGLRDGFSALVNYHMLDNGNLDRLIYVYLGEWIQGQRAGVSGGEDGAEERLAAAQGLKQRLEAIKAGEAPIDIFVRWKPIEEQSIGWDPDLNDGVRLNARPFMTVDDVGRKGAGILRWKPNIHWKKDRGKDVESAPWYLVFNGERINDHHLTLEEKRAARAAVGKDS